jgi:hypothetical protein
MVPWTRIDSVSWRALVPTSLAGALLALIGLVVATPRPAAPQIVCCIGCSGNKCYDECTKECSDGSCCKWEYYYRKTASDTLGEEDPEG